MSAPRRGVHYVMTADDYLSAPAPFTPAWWAAWTYRLARPGQYDDEDVPPWCGPQCISWDHVETEDAVDYPRRDLGVRPDWPTMVARQRSREPVPSDHCCVHGGRCSGACVCGDVV